ncbi:8846_t:CDS:2, partial [Dentiscutata erythropus]
EEANCTECTDYFWTEKNPVTAIIKFDNLEIKGRFSLYDNMKDSGTQISGSFVRGMKLNKPYLYKFITHIYSTCDNVHKNEFFAFDVSHSFLPRKVKTIRSNKFGSFKTTSNSWYWGHNIPTVVLAYQKSSLNSKTWKFKGCAELIMKDKESIKKPKNQLNPLENNDTFQSTFDNNTNTITRDEVLSSSKELQDEVLFNSSKTDKKYYVDIEITDDFKI